MEKRPDVASTARKDAMVRLDRWVPCRGQWLGPSSPLLLFETEVIITFISPHGKVAAGSAKSKIIIGTSLRRLSWSMNEGSRKSEVVSASSHKFRSTTLWKHVTSHDSRGIRNAVRRASVVHIVPPSNVPRRPCPDTDSQESRGRDSEAKLCHLLTGAITHALIHDSLA